MHNKIELTKEELEEIKDEVKFRTKVLIALKELSGIPQKVTVLETHKVIQWWFIAAIILAILVEFIKNGIK